MATVMWCKRGLFVGYMCVNCHLHWLQPPDGPPRWTRPPPPSPSTWRPTPWRPHRPRRRLCATCLPSGRFPSPADGERWWAACTACRCSAATEYEWIKRKGGLKWEVNALGPRLVIRVIHECSQLNCSNNNNGLNKVAKQKLTLGRSPSDFSMLFW